MTEDEAKLKWCPFARKGMRSPTSANIAEAMRDQTYHTISDEVNCIASACMAWRGESYVEIVVENDEQADPWVKAGWTKAIRKSDGVYVVYQPAVGRCGLAGNP